MAWRLEFYTDNTGSNIESWSKSWTLVVEVPKYSFCFVYDLELREYSVEWIFHSSGNIYYIPTSSIIGPGTCGVKDHSFSKTSIYPPVVIIATDVSPARTQERSGMVDQCRQVWEHDKGVTVAMGDNSVIQLVSIGASATNVAMALGNKRITQTNATHDNTKNISCILFKNGNYTESFFTTPRVETEPQVLVTTHRIDTRNQSPAPPTLGNRHGFFSVVVPAAAVVVALSISGLASVTLKLRLYKVQYNRHTRRATASSALRTCRSASLPALRYTKKEIQEDTTSCKSLPSALVSTEPTYSVIPDNVAAAQRPLPAFPPTYNLLDAVAADQSAIPHTYCEIPDHEDDGMKPNLLYAAAADLSLCTGSTPYGDGIKINQADLVSAFCSHYSVADRESAVNKAALEVYTGQLQIPPVSKKGQAKGLERRASLP
ncbi:hypothetical protein Bbelb_124570 [Branchiostoma belcheri]|nr:hypothetical protein Bbelb_124570 [Branchiostoma belcheri]